MDDLPLASVSSCHPSPRPKVDLSPTRAAMRGGQGRGGNQTPFGTNPLVRAVIAVRITSATATLIPMIYPHVVAFCVKFDAIIICPRKSYWQGSQRRGPSVLSVQALPLPPVSPARGRGRPQPQPTYHVPRTTYHTCSVRLLAPTGERLLFCCLEDRQPLHPLTTPIARQILRSGANTPQFCPASKAQGTPSGASDGGGRQQPRLSRSWPRRHRPCSWARNGRLASMRLAGLVVCLSVCLYASLPDSLPGRVFGVWVGCANPTGESACLGSWRWWSRQWRLSLTPGGRGGSSSNYGRFAGQTGRFRGFTYGCDDRDAGAEARCLDISS